MHEADFKQFYLLSVTSQPWCVSVCVLFVMPQVWLKVFFFVFFLLITVFHALIFVSECRFVIKIEFLSPTFFYPSFSDIFSTFN